MLKQAAIDAMIDMMTIKQLYCNCVETAQMLKEL